MPAAKKTMLAAICDELLIALQYQMQISAHLAFSSLAQKDDSHWGPSLDCMEGAVTLPVPVGSQSPKSNVQR